MTFWKTTDPLPFLRVARSHSHPSLNSPIDFVSQSLMYVLRDHERAHTQFSETNDRNPLKRHTEEALTDNRSNLDLVVDDFYDVEGVGA